MLASLGVLDVSDTRHMHSNSLMLAIAEADGNPPSLAEAGEGHHLPGLRDLEGKPFAGFESLQTKRTNKSKAKMK